MERFVMPDGLARQLCDRLGAAWPVTFDDVGRLYERWCANVPFDPIAKALALRQDRTPPGADPVEFAERWLATGVGGTCWGHIAGLAGVLGAAGIETRVGIDRMLRDLVDFHAFLVVDDDGTRFLLDPIHGTGRPLRMEPGAEADHPVYKSGIAADESRLLHWFTPPRRPAELDQSARADQSGPSGRYVVLSTDLDAADARAFCEVSRHYSGVGAHRFFHRRFPPDGFSVARPTEDGAALAIDHWSARGVEHCEIDDVAEALRSLGYAPAGIDLAADAGLLERRPDGSWRFVV